MSGYINKDTLMKDLKKSRKHHAQNGREIELLCRCENIVKEQPTLDEKEIICKAFERVVMILEEAQQHTEEKRNDVAMMDGHTLTYEFLDGKQNGYTDAIKIIKEECGINE